MNIQIPIDLEFLIRGYVFVFVRIAAFVALLPGFGESSIPARVKLAIAISISFIIYPLTDAPNFDFERGGPWVGVLLIEIALGVWFGLLLRVFVFCLQTAGSIAAQSTSLSQILGMAGVEPLPAIGHVLTVSGLALALALGLHIEAVHYLVGSYQMFPIGRLPDITIIVNSVVQQIASGFKLAFALAAPFFILSLLYNLTLGVINRAMPQLMVAFVGAPVITAGAILLLAISIPLILQTWVQAFFEFMRSGQFN